MTTLYVLEDGELCVANAHHILACAQELIADDYRSGQPVLSDYPKLEAFLRVHLGLKDYEVFGLLHLTTQHRLIAMEDLFRGTVDGGAVYAREVVRSVINHGAARVMFYHNHPSGDARPSAKDRAVTDKLVQALDLIDVPVLDHLIVGERVFSFRNARLL